MVCGFIIGNYGWRVVFYMNGSLGVAWCLLWWLLAFDLPHKHPRITRRELNYINANIGENIISTKVRRQISNYKYLFFFFYHLFNNNIVIGCKSSMVFYHDLYSSMVNWYNNIWSDLGPLYFYNIWSILHEDNIRFQYTKGLFLVHFFFLYDIRIKQLISIIIYYRMDL